MSAATVPAASVVPSAGATATDLAAQPASAVDPLERGVWSVLATPFRDAGREVDLPGLARLAEFSERCGVVGLTVLGVFGEAASLAPAERSLVLRTVAESCGLPLVVGVSSLATAPAIDEISLARDAVQGRLRAAMVQVNSANPAVVVEHLRAIHAETGAPIVVQDYPVASGVAVLTETLLAVLAECPFICAVKAEAPPTAAAIARIAPHTSASVFGGLGGQSLLDELAVGAAGAMTGFSYPEALVACVAAWRNGDPEGAQDAFAPYLPLVNYEQQPRIALALRKDLLMRRGLIDDGSVRAPAAPFPEQLSEIAAAQLARVERHEGMR